MVGSCGAVQAAAVAAEGGAGDTGGVGDTAVGATEPVAATPVVAAAAMPAAAAALPAAALPAPPPPAAAEEEGSDDDPFAAMDSMMAEGDGVAPGAADEMDGDTDASEMLFDPSAEAETSFEPSLSGVAETGAAAADGVETADGAAAEGGAEAEVANNDDTADQGSATSTAAATPATPTASAAAAADTAASTGGGESKASLSVFTTPVRREGKEGFDGVAEGGAAAATVATEDATASDVAASEMGGVYRTASEEHREERKVWEAEVSADDDKGNTKALRAEMGRERPDVNALRRLCRTSVAICARNPNSGRTMAPADVHSDVWMLLLGLAADEIDGLKESGVIA